ncbi:MAG: UDP-N-acetylmuramoyl-L-alanyl-D-glutamate--2,6-diaminopimelate ligase [Alphaproteobacteria bacterium]|nr:UDP-N-acetylmuramoyl-L-alanyl-D-glutamate--2,6-diaminopimelate ligase [Alphaproteobacteria bacterium]
MRLSDLIRNGQGLPAQYSRLGDAAVTGLTADSRAVEPGYVFAALPGNKTDGRKFIADAVAKGAICVVAPDGTEPVADVPVIGDPDPRGKLAKMAARFYGRQPTTLAAVTGTNGKTSVADFTRQLWQEAGHRAGSLGTLGLVGDGLPSIPSLTTPDPVALHKLLKETAEAGIEHMVLEASSHGLDQRRLDGVCLTAAAFTNLTRDHLDYHGSMEAYLAAKAGLFDRVLNDSGTAVVTTDDPASQAIFAICRRRKLRTITFGKAESADLRLIDKQPTPSGQTLNLDLCGERVTVAVPLAGDFQALNILAAIGLVHAGGVPLDRIVAALPRLCGVRGRMERVATLTNGAAVYVDYAHTPDALETVLRAARPHTKNRLHVVFGCGGDRDPGKRPQMGAACRRYADRVVLTDDNPRSEDPALIRDQAVKGCPGAENIAGRAEAIRVAIAGLLEGDVLVIAGKGHEQGQEVKGEMLPFDDATVARDAVRALDEGDGA